MVKWVETGISFICIPLYVWYDGLCTSLPAAVSPHTAAVLFSLCINEVLQFSEGKQLIKVRNKNPFYCAVVYHQPLKDAHTAYSWIFLHSHSR